MNPSLKNLFSKNKIAKIDYVDKNIYICCNTEKELKLRVNCCKREPDTIKFIENKLSKKSLFVDVGANVGTYSLIASSIHGNECLSIEPAYFNYISLIKNIEINKLTNKIYPINAAISDSLGITNIYFTTNLSGSGLTFFPAWS